MRTQQGWAILLGVAMLAANGLGAPSIQHDPIQTAEKGQALGVRATVRDAASRVESVSLFYATSRGMTPFRVAMSSSGAGTWYATIPGHMIGPGSRLLYYIQAENIEGEAKETDWFTVNVVEPGIAPEAIPAASEVAREAQRQAVPAVPPTAPPPPPRPARNRYLVPGAIIVGGAVAVGGAFVIAENNSGSSGGGAAPAITNANFGGNYNFCFDPATDDDAPFVCDSGLANIYIREGAVEVIGLWGAELFTTTLSGTTFSVARSVPATAVFPES